MIYEIKLTANSCIALCSSRNAASFSSARTTKRFAIGYANFFSRSHDAVIRVYDDVGNVIDMHEHTGDFKE